MKCIGCGKEFKPKRPQQQFHNAVCLRAYGKRAMNARIKEHRAQKHA